MNGAIAAAAVTPNDGVDLPGGKTRALWVGTGGNVAVIMPQDPTAFGTVGSAVTFTNVPSGYLLPVSATRVMVTNTTASNIVAVY
jgi:hypothetical protein